MSTNETKAPLGLEPTTEHDVEQYGTLEELALTLYEMTDKLPAEGRARMLTFNILSDEAVLILSMAGKTLEDFRHGAALAEVLGNPLTPEELRRLRCLDYVLDRYNDQLEAQLADVIPHDETETPSTTES